MIGDGPASRWRELLTAAVASVVAIAVGVGTIVLLLLIAR